MYRSAFLGCGPRARGHAEAYARITRAQRVAACDVDEARLNRFADDFAIPHRYRDAAEMLERERPDLLHIVTNPNLRVPLMTLAEEHGVPAAIVEKPIALDVTDFRAITELSRRARTKFVVNHQLRFHPKVRELCRDVAEGRIGAVRLVDASARALLAEQGTHITDLMFTFQGDRTPASLFGQVSGARRLADTHPAPEMAQASLALADGARGVIQCGTNAPVVPEAPGSIYMHKRIAVYGTRGYVEWRMEAWERLTLDGGCEHGRHTYAEEDLLGQAALTEAVCDWLDDDARPHPNHLATSLAELNVLLALYASALRRAPVALPFSPEKDLLPALRETLSIASGLPGQPG
jgi:predicted dehydrogenase